MEWMTRRSTCLPRVRPQPTSRLASNASRRRTPGQSACCSPAATSNGKPGRAHRRRRTAPAHGPGRFRPGAAQVRCPTQQRQTAGSVDGARDDLRRVAEDRVTTRIIEAFFRHKLLLLLPPFLIPLIVGPIALMSAPVYYEAWTGIWVDRPQYLAYNQAGWTQYLTPAQNQATA